MTPHTFLAPLACAATLVASAASAQTIPNGGVAQANRKLSIYQTVNGGYPASGMPLVKRVMTDANGYFIANGLPAANNIVVDLNGAKNATLTLAASQAVPHAVRAMPAGGDFEGRAIKYSNGEYKLLCCDRNNANARKDAKQTHTFTQRLSPIEAARGRVSLFAQGAAVFEFTVQAN